MSDSLKLAGFYRQCPRAPSSSVAITANTMFSRLRNGSKKKQPPQTRARQIPPPPYSRTSSSKLNLSFATVPENPPLYFQPRTYTALFLSNPHATPPPTWNRLMSTFHSPFSRLLQPDPDSHLVEVSGLTSFPSPHSFNGLTLQNGGETERWTLLDATGREIEDVESKLAELESGLLGGAEQERSLAFVVLVINVGDYNPQSFAGTARFERDRALLRMLCADEWAADAELVVCLDGVEETRGKDAGYGFFNAVVAGFKQVGSEEGREVGAYFLQRVEDEVEMSPWRFVSCLAASLKDIGIEMKRKRIKEEVAAGA
ncbi:MAG: hypothetical protein LQ340_000034 [Diploschistes diacapsis]|nr:MAG: hypothetical protein LQ340_000034 [Diploschistes diacapsis]